MKIYNAIARYERDCAKLLSSKLSVYNRPKYDRINKKLAKRKAKILANKKFITTYQ